MCTRHADLSLAKTLSPTVEYTYWYFKKKQSANLKQVAQSQAVAAMETRVRQLVREETVTCRQRIWIFSRKTGGEIQFGLTQLETSRPLGFA
jgi:hypothetical protein